MNMVIGYSMIALLFLVVIIVLERSRKKERDFVDYAVAGRSFGPVYSGMAFLNTWLPGSFFIGFAGMAAKDGVIAFYYLPYSLLVIVLMMFMASRVTQWGVRFSLTTQSGLLGLRYKSSVVQWVCAVVGIVSAFPWIVLAMQSLGLVFEYLSFGRVTHLEAVVIGVVVLAVRQVWTVRMGMRGIVLSDFVQGIIAYPLAIVVVFGLIVWMTMNGTTISSVPGAKFELPGLGSEMGPLYLFSLVLTSALGGWCWPDIFARMFSASGAQALKRSALLVAPLLLLFATALTVAALLAGDLPGVAERPDAVLLLIAEQAGGAVLVGLMGTMIVAATVGNVGANLQAGGVQVSNDLVGVANKSLSDKAHTRIAKIAVATLTILAAIIASWPSDNLVILAILSYQGVVQLAPALFLGIFWMRGNRHGALWGTAAGFVTAVVLQIIYPATAVPWLAGLTSGVAGLIVNVSVYVTCAYLLPHNKEERQRLSQMFVATADPCEGKPAAGHERDSDSSAATRSLRSQSAADAEHK